MFPWGRTDYDARVPGAGMFRTTWQCYAHVLWNESPSYHNGPIFSEGSCQWLYAGISDGNYGQMGRAGQPRWRRPPLVDFDLLKMHPLMCDFGMGAPSMFYARHDTAWRKGGSRSEFLDRFITSTLAFGHIGYLALDWGFDGALKCYYMTNAVQQRYALVPVAEIRYFDGQKLLTPSDAIRTGAYKRGQVYIKYESGLRLWCNLSFEDDWPVPSPQGSFLLPPTGHLATDVAGLVQCSVLIDGKRIDYVKCKEYEYLDTRGAFAAYGRLAGRGAIAFKFPKPGGERACFIPAEKCGDITWRTGGVVPKVVALDRDGQSLGEAEVRHSNIGCTIMAVKGAWRYRVTGSRAGSALPADRRVRRLVAGLEYPIDGIVRGFTYGQWSDVTAVEVERMGAASVCIHTPMGRPTTNVPSQAPRRRPMARGRSESASRRTRSRTSGSGTACASAPMSTAGMCSGLAGSPAWPRGPLIASCGRQRPRRRSQGAARSLCSA